MVTLTYNGMTNLVASDSSASYSWDPAGQITGINSTAGGKGQPDANTRVAADMQAKARQLTADAAWWLGGGGGIQYELPASVRWLMENGLLKSYGP